MQLREVARQLHALKTEAIAGTGEAAAGAPSRRVMAQVYAGLSEKVGEGWQALH